MTEEMQAISDLTKQIAALDKKVNQTEKNIAYMLFLLGGRSNVNANAYIEILRWLRRYDKEFNKVAEEAIEVGTLLFHYVKKQEEKKND